MAARRKKNKGITKLISSMLGALRSKKRRRKASWVGPGLLSIARILAVVCFLSGAALGLLVLEEYVNKTVVTSGDAIYLELAGVPSWVDDQLKEKVCSVVENCGGSVRYNDDAALSVQRSIERQVAWLDDVKVRARQDGLRVEGRWRKPIAVIKSNLPEPCYVDSEQVVLDFVQLPDLPIVEITGLAMNIDIPSPGQVWQCDDLAAATKILDRMNQMDKTFTPDKPLMFETDRIDVKNYNGRQNSQKPHIVLYTKDGIEITWGAEWGKWQQYLESTDQEKLAKLWGYYRQHETLSVGIKYINLRDPQDKIPLPIDKY
ncbi:MAG: cell division protein FtsQ/DivIB [Planctomycetota bacterium]|jgi:hypothetical protein